MRYSLLALPKRLVHSLAKILAIGLLFLAAPLFAETWTDPATGIKWEYSPDDSGEATIKRASNASGFLIIPSTINGHSVTAIGWGVFQDCPGITSVTIPNSVTEIREFAFAGCTSLSSITIPDSVTTIGWNAFWGCASLSSMTIPDSVTLIEDGAFAGCGAVFVEKGNTAYKSTPEGILMSANGRELLHAPVSISAYTIPKSVTTIGSCAFSGCASLTSIIVPESVTEIKQDAFSGCINLYHTYILNKTCKIHPQAFARSPTEIVFGPPPEETVPEEMSPYLFWVYVEAGILAVVGAVLGIWWWRKRKARARQ